VDARGLFDRFSELHTSPGLVGWSSFRCPCSVEHCPTHWSAEPCSDRQGPTAKTEPVWLLWLASRPTRRHSTNNARHGSVARSSLRCKSRPGARFRQLLWPPRLSRAAQAHRGWPTWGDRGRAQPSSHCKVPASQPRQRPELSGAQPSQTRSSLSQRPVQFWQEALSQSRGGSGLLM
jgi:hypothetical protein